MRRRRKAAGPARRQRGVFAIMYGILLVPILIVAGMAIDLSFAYTRRTDMQDLADSAALAAARTLDGTMAGVTAAAAKASAVATANFQGMTTQIAWTPAALRFGAAPDPAATWYSAGSVTPAIAATLRYARVDTAELDSAFGTVPAFFAKVIDGGGLRVKAVAIAGASAARIFPLAICAISNVPVASRSNAPAAGMAELLEYGFRRGVNYNLLNLNPGGTSPKSYMVNPLDFPPAARHASHDTVEAVKPFVCNGTLATTAVAAGSTLYVVEPFPAALAAEINARFNDYSGSSCDRLAAPPDATVRAFNDYAGAAGFWMNAPQPLPGSAQPFTGATSLLTVADVDGKVAGTDYRSFGPLWAFAKPVRFNGGASDGVGLPFSKSDWPALYQVAGGPAPSSNYTDARMPYYNGAPHVLTPPGVTAVAERRVLQIALLNCPVAAAAPVQVLGVGRFLMTSRATVAPTALHAEFGGLVTSSTSLPAAAVALFR